MIAYCSVQPLASGSWEDSGCGITGAPKRTLRGHLVAGSVQMETRLLVGVGTIRLGCERRAQIHPHRAYGDVYSISFSPDGNTLASGSWDRQHPTHPHRASASVLFNPSGNTQWELGPNSAAETPARSNTPSPDIRCRKRIVQSRWKHACQPEWECYRATGEWT